MENLPELASLRILSNLDFESIKLLRFTSKIIDAILCDLVPELNKWRLCVKTKDDFDTINEVMQAAIKRNDDRIYNLRLSLDLGFQDLDEKRPLHLDLLNWIKSYGDNITELRMMLPLREFVLASQIFCPNLEYLWVGGCSETDDLASNNNSILLYNKLLLQHYQSLKKLDVNELPKFDHAAKYTFPNLHLLKANQCSVESVLSLLQASAKTLKLVCIANSYSEGSDLDSLRDFSTFDIKLPKLRHLLVCNSDQGYLNLILGSLATLETLEIFDYDDHIQPEFVFDNFKPRLQNSGGFKKLNYLRLDSAILDFLITNSSKTLQSLTVGFKNVYNVFSPPTKSKLPKLKHLYLRDSMPQWFRDLMIQNCGHLETLRIQLPDLGIINIGCQFVKLQSVIFPAKYKKGCLDTLKSRYCRPTCKVIFGGWREMYIFPAYTGDAKVWHGANGPYGVLGQQVPIMRILDD
eukprot:TRINITY_DN7967_c0_g1_i5.p1 TRINITY_DN7967_c0_g1~~TRINITY_DN7967_c0_g1_i5.p1  ORF type:complete len:474 (+),score=66.82 TRINITY_DN7967_c0_g1_i5:32-1423(+)